MGQRLFWVALVVALAVPAGASAAPNYLVAVGDSYTIGYQPGGLARTDGFNDQVVTKARARGYRFTLANFGCGGATTTSLLKQRGCPADARAEAGVMPYSGTQITAAAKFIKAHRKQVGLVTVSISGNDVTSCASAADPVPCVVAAQSAIKRNVKTALTKLRAAGGSKLRIVGTTYPDVILGEFVRDATKVELAKLSVVAFQSIINPALKTTYTDARAKFVDVTAATGAYTPLEQLTDLAPYGSIPVAVAKVCELTWYCEKGDIHARASGYGVIADLIVKTLPRR